MTTTTRTQTANLTTGSSFIAQAVRYTVVGSSAMLVYLGIYAALATSMDVVLANVVAWVISTVLCNMAHRRLTFGVTSNESSRADATIGMATALAGLAMSSVVVSVFESAATLTQLLALIGGTAIGGASRFLIMRWWMNRTHGLTSVELVTVFELPENVITSQELALAA